MKITTTRTQNKDGSFTVTASFEGSEDEVKKAMDAFEKRVKDETGLDPDWT